MTINEQSGVTPYRQVAAALRDLIQSGVLRPGDQLPATKELTQRYEVAPATAVRAVDELRREGLIETERGRGSFVLDAPELIRWGANRYRRGVGHAPNLDESINGRWIERVEASSTTEEADDRIARRLHIEPGEGVSRADYRRLVGAHPVQISTQYEPLVLTENTSAEIPASGDRDAPDVITRFDRIGIYIDRVEEHTRTRMPTANESERLSLGGGVPVFVIERTHWAGDRAVETADIVIRGDRMVLTTTHPVPIES